MKGSINTLAGAWLCCSRYGQYIQGMAYLMDVFSMESGKKKWIQAYTTKVITVYIV